MQHLDSDYVDNLLARINSLPDDAVPAWGKLRKQSLIEHFIWILRHSMGRSDQVPYMGNWISERIVGPLYLRGLVPTPKNLSFEESHMKLFERGDMETLQALLEEYLALVQADELKPARHVLFGDIGVDGWDRLHIRHFEYHCKQFGI